MQPGTIQSTRIQLATLVVVIMLVAGMGSAMANQVVGSALLVKGVVTASADGTRTRTLAKQSEVFLGETITTASDSFVVLKMSDDSKISLRPNTEMVLEKFNQESGREEALFDLARGGLRALSGSIGAKQPEKFQVNTSIATIGIRGTDFYVRLCLDDCSLEEESFGGLDKKQAGPPDGSGTTRKKELRRLNDNNEVASRSTLECKPLVELKTGLYVAVFEGKIFVRRGNEEIDLEAVEAVFIEDKEILCMGQIPNFIFRDPFLQENAEQVLQLYNILKNLSEKNPFCAVPEA